MTKELIIMLIDDNETDNLITEKIIEITAISSKVFSFSSARKALDFLESNAGTPAQLPDLIFLDINMPLVNGDQFLLEMEAMSAYLAKDPKVVLLSSYYQSMKGRLGNNQVISALSKPLLKADFERIAKDFQKINLKVA